MIVMLNNKCNFTKEEFISYQKELLSVKTFNSKLVLYPSTLYLPFYEKSDIELGSQDVSEYKVGSHTGNIAASQLKSLKVNYSLVGHSERRNEQGEDDLKINNKIKRLLEEDINVVLCVGENLSQRQSGNYLEVIIQQIKNALDKIDIDYNKLIIAYEPIWSIGTGKILKKEDIEEVVLKIKDFCPVKVLYGGSVDDNNIEKLTTPVIDGFLLGRVSLYPKKVQSLISKINNIEVKNVN